MNTSGFRSLLLVATWFAVAAALGAQDRARTVYLPDRFKSSPSVVASPDGLLWMVPRAQMARETWDHTLRLDFSPIFQGVGNSAQPTSERLPVTFGEFNLSPNMKYIGGSRILSKIERPGNPAKAYFTTVRKVPESGSRKTEPQLRYNDQHFVVALLDDGRAITTKPKITEAKRGPFYVSEYRDLFLTDLVSGQQTLLYKGVAAGTLNHYDRRPQRQVTRDNAKFLLQSGRAVHISDLLSGKTVTVEVPATEGGYPLLTPWLFTTIADDTLLAVAGLARTATSGEKTLQPYVSVFELATGRLLYTQRVLTPEAQGHWRILTLGDSLVFLQPNSLEIQLLNIGESSVETTPAIKLDTTGLSLPELNRLDYVLSYTPDGIMLTTIPSSPVANKSFPFYMFNLSTGRLAYRVIAFAEAPPPGSRPPPPPTLAAEDCEKYRAEAQRFRGSAFRLPDGKLHHIVGFDCTRGVFVLAREEKSLVARNPVTRRDEYLPHSNAVFSTMTASDAMLRGRVRTGLVLCPGCDGRPTSLSRSTVEGWTWKPVLGLTWYVQTNTTETRTFVAICATCQGKAFVPGGR